MKKYPVSHLQLALNYEFRHIIFLEEALTHSCSSSNGYYPESGFNFKTQTNFELQILGECVLNMVAMECVGNTIPMPGFNSEIFLLLQYNKLVASPILKIVGNDLGLEDFIKVTDAEKRVVGYDEESLFPGILKAIFGAVYVDSQFGSPSVGLQKCYGLFLWLWRNHVEETEKLNKEVYSKVGLQPSWKYFFQSPSPEVDIIKILQQKGTPTADICFNPNGFEYLQTTCLGYKFNHRRLLLEAFTHNSVIWKYKELKNTRDMRCLQVFGRAAYKLSIAEYLFWCSVGQIDMKNGKESRLCPEMLNKFTSDKYKNLIALGLGLTGYVLREPLSMETRNSHEFLESLVGALYVDSKEEHGFNFVNFLVVVFVDNMQIFAKPTLGYYLPPGVKRKCRAYNTISTTNDKAPLLLLGYRHNISLDLDRFLQHWEDFAVSAKEHFCRFQRALDCEWNIKHKAQKDYLPPDLNKALQTAWTEERCIRREFERFSVYNVAARIHIELSRGKTLNTYSTNIDDVLKLPNEFKKRDHSKNMDQWLQWPFIDDNMPLNAEDSNEDVKNTIQEVTVVPNSSTFLFGATIKYLQAAVWLELSQLKSEMETIIVTLITVTIFCIMFWVKPPMLQDF